MPAEDVVARLVVDEGQFASKMQGATGATQQAGKGAEQASKGFGDVAKNLAIAAGGAAVAKKGFGFLQDAAGDAQKLAKQTAGLTRQTGMDTKAASGWVSMAKSRGIQSSGLTRSFTALSRQLVNAEQGSKTAIGGFERLGVSMDDIRGKPFDEQLGAVADRFEALPAGADKAALATKLFGRSGLDLLPILNSGSQGINEQLGAMESAGLTMDKSGVEKAIAYGKAQREMQASIDGVKIAIGQALIPVMKTLADVFKPIIQAFSWGAQNIPGFNLIIIAAAGALGGLMIIAVILPLLGLLAGALGISTGALLGFVGAALLAALPFIAIAVGIAALIAGLVIAYKKVGWFRDAVDAAFGAIKAAIGAAFGAIKTAASVAFDWLKRYWPLLLGILAGPFGLAVGLVIMNFGKIKAAATAARDFVVNAFKAIIAAIRRLPGEIAGIAEGPVQGDHQRREGAPRPGARRDRRPRLEDQGQDHGAAQRRRRRDREPEPVRHRRADRRADRRQRHRPTVRARRRARARDRDDAGRHQDQPATTAAARRLAAHRRRWRRPAGDRPGVPRAADDRRGDGLPRRRRAGGALMGRWRPIPVTKQKPGKLVGGHWVVIQAYAVSNHWTLAMLGPEGARVTGGGYGGWDQTAVPRSLSITEWNNQPNMEMTIDLLFDGWLAHPIIPQLRASFIDPPRLPTGVRFQNRHTGRPVGPVVKSSTRRPLAPPPKRPGHLPRTNSAILNRHGDAVARRLPAPQTRRPAPVRRRGSARPQGVWIESMLADLESLAIRQTGDETPHSVRLYGAVPHTEKRWVIQGLEWGDCIRDTANGRRMRQQVTVNLLEYYQPAALRRLPRGKAA